MLTYHPALDPYNTCLRMLRILNAVRPCELEYDKIRILDFFLLFPEFINEIKLPLGLVKFRKFFKNKNKYFFNGQPTSIFNQMSMIHYAAASVLNSRGLIKKELFEKKILDLAADIPSSIIEVITKRNLENPQLIILVSQGLAKLPLLGEDGLKHLSGLLEFRYDAV